MRLAKPSTIAVFPTPGSPTSTGLFFVRRERICITRSISSARPITGSIFFCSFCAVKSTVKRSKTVGLLVGFVLVFWLGSGGAGGGAITIGGLVSPGSVISSRIDEISSTLGNLFALSRMWMISSSSVSCSRSI